MDKIVAASSPGGQWLPFRGRDVVPSLSLPYAATPSLPSYLEVAGSIPETPEIFHFNIITINCSIKLCSFTNRLAFHSIAIFPLSLPEFISYLPSCVTFVNHRTSFYFLPSNTLTHCMAVLLRKSEQRMVQGTGMADSRRSAPME